MSDVDRNISRAIHQLHVAELWVLPEYRFDSTVVRPKHMTAQDLVVVWERGTP